MDKMIKPASRAEMPRRSDRLMLIAGVSAVLLTMGTAVSSLQANGPGSPVANATLP